MKVLRHPLMTLSATKRTLVFIGTLILTFAAMSIFHSLDHPLQTPAAPWGMLSFEFAKTSENSKQILDSWDVTARSNAQSSLLLDFLFPACYSTLLTLGCFWAARVFQERGYVKTAWLSTAAAWAQWPAACFDYVENIALWMQLRGSVNDPWPSIAFTCATIKFLLILWGLGLLFAALAVWVMRRRLRGPVPL